ncbi:MAG: FAD-dependent oxidoreductase [Nocardioidaceae bacterium]|nr:FAD-dependent oxidoreductase [Nocardioidaceae bacterium]
MSIPWDVLVVGGGTAGLVSAKTAASFGARVLLVERKRTGGDCLWTGCVPSKALLAAASSAADARAASRLGVVIDGVSVDFSRVMDHVRSAIAAIEPADSPRSLEAAGVRVESGDLTFTGPRSAVIDGRPVDFHQAIICSGSSPAVPPIPGLAAASPLTSDSVWGLETIPGRFAILGGGSIGCELGQAFARLGSEVTIVEGADRILTREDPQAASLVAEALTRDGVTFRTGSPVVEVKSALTTGQLILENGVTVDFDRLLVSVGRRPRTSDLGLDRAGVALDKLGYVRVDKQLRTTNASIWAAGDVSGHPQFTHTAGVNGSLAASNAILGLRRRVDTTTIPRVTFTSPEVAAVGVSTETAARRSELRVVNWDHEHLDRAVVESDVHGFTKFVVDGKGRVLGATVVGPRAGETLGELILAVRHGLRTRDIAGTTHPYPTYNDGVWNASIDDVRSQLRTPPAARAIRVLSTTRRRWLGSSLRKGLDNRPGRGG